VRASTSVMLNKTVYEIHQGQIVIIARAGHDVHCYS